MMTVSNLVKTEVSGDIMGLPVCQQSLYEVYQLPIQNISEKLSFWLLQEWKTVLSSYLKVTVCPSIEILTLVDI